MGRTTGTAERGSATGTASMTGGLPDTGTGPPSTSCSKLHQKLLRSQTDECLKRATAMQTPYMYVYILLLMKQKENK